VALTDAGTEADARAHVAQAAANRAELSRSRLEQEKALVESRAKWLDEELGRKSELLQSERRASSAQASRNQLCQVDTKISRKNSQATWDCYPL